MPSITQLEYLIALDREKHFNKAAISCNVSQPSLSIQVQKIEDYLNVKIFDRSKKPILTTGIGQQIIKQAKKTIKEHNKIQSIASQSGTTPKGQFNIAIIPTIAPYLIPLFLGEFSLKFPEVSLNIVEHKTDDIIKLIVDDELDAAILVTPLYDDRIIENHLYYEPFYAFVSEDHQLAQKKIIGEDDLKPTNFWILEEGHCFRNQVLKVCKLDKNSSGLPNVVFSSGSLETLKNLVKQNSGYTFLPELAINCLSSEDKKNHLRKLKNPTPTREVSFVYSKSFLKEKIIKAMESVIKEKLPKEIKSLRKKNLTIIDI